MKDLTEFSLNTGKLFLNCESSKIPHKTCSFSAIVVKAFHMVGRERDVDSEREIEATEWVICIE